MARDGILLADNLRERLNSEIESWGKKNDFAVASDIHPTTLSRYISGKTSPTLEALQRMADVLGVRVEWLMGIDDCRTEADKLRDSRVKNRHNDPRQTPLGVLLRAYGYQWEGTYLEGWPFDTPVNGYLTSEAEADQLGVPVPGDPDEDLFFRYYYGSRIYEYKNPKGRTVYIHEDNFNALERQIKSTIKNFVDTWEGAGPSDQELASLSPKASCWIMGPND